MVFLMERGRVTTCMYSPHARGRDDGNERVVFLMGGEMRVAMLI